jgi:hypothetical protein
MTNRDTDYHDRLEQEITSLKRENNALRREIDALTHTNQAVSMLAGLPTAREMETLIKDGKRLDWLIDNASIYIFRKDEDGDEWWGDLEYSEPRKDIDKAMEEANNDRT